MATFGVSQKRLASNLVTFSCVIGDLSGILETNVNVSIVPHQLQLRQVLPLVLQRYQVVKSGHRMTSEGSYTQEQQNHTGQTFSLLKNCC